MSLIRLTSVAVVAFTAAFLAGCSDPVATDEDENSVQSSGFNGTKGWALLKTIKYDHPLVGVDDRGRLAVHDVAFNGTNLQALYSQGKKSQQDFIVTSSRLDEYGADFSLAKRDSLPWVASIVEFIANNTTSYYDADFTRYFIRNTKATVMKLSPGSQANALHWSLIEDNIDVMTGPNLYLGQAGLDARIDNNNFFAFSNGELQDTKAPGWVTWYTNNVMHTSEIEYSLPAMYSFARIVGMDHINNETYCFFQGTISGGDSSFFAVMKYDSSIGGTKPWVLSFECRFARNDFSKYTRVSFYDFGHMWGNKYNTYFNNNGTPIIVTAGGTAGATIYVHRIDMTARSVSQMAEVILPSRGFYGYYSLAQLAGEVYIGYCGDSASTTPGTTVAKLSGSSLIPVGLSGFANEPSRVQLFARNGRLYSVTIGRSSIADLSMDEAYIAVAE